VIRLCLLPRARGWTYDSTAHALARHLDDRFLVSIAYDDAAALSCAPDLVLDFWWAGRLHRQQRVPVVKQVSSHRWRRCGYAPNMLARLHLMGCSGVVVPSQRLKSILDRTVASRIAPSVGPKGFEPSAFHDDGLRAGLIVVGWAGNASMPDKRVELILGAEPGALIADRCLTLGEMPDFYNALDVIAVASNAEGDPRTLIEAMACGCFPVCVDVGVVPELVRHGDNGLIVERSVEGFAAAFAWCRAHPREVRDAGRRNAIAMQATRTWAAVVPSWADALAAAHKRSRA
jgi:hypothetical protein